MRTELLCLLSCATRSTGLFNSGPVGRRGSASFRKGEPCATVTTTALTGSKWCCAVTVLTRVITDTVFLIQLSVSLGVATGPV